METPELIDAIVADIARALGQVDPAQIDKAIDMILAADRVFIAGKGRSGLQMRAFAMRLMHVGLRVDELADVQLIQNRGDVRRDIGGAVAADDIGDTQGMLRENIHFTFDDVERAAGGFDRAL